MQISKEGLALIQHFEGCYLHAYLDSVKVPTIAWGRIVYPDGTKVKMGDTCTQEQADEWLRQDVESEAAKYMRAWVKEPLTQYEFDALVSFCYNRGAGRLKQVITKPRSMWMQLLVEYNWAGSDHRYLLGLDRRRWAERYMYERKGWECFKDQKFFEHFKSKGYR